MPPSPADIRTRMSRWRRRVAGAGLGVFAGSWIAVLALGQHAHAGASTAATTQPSSASQPAPATVAQDPYTGGTYAGPSSAAPSTGASQQSQAPLVTRQS